jgi:hypothetical protein
LNSSPARETRQDSSRTVAPRSSLNALQLKVLQWVADSSPPNVVDGNAHRISAAALRSRGLIKISGRGKRWTAQITQSGRTVLGAAGGQVNPDDGSLDQRPEVRSRGPRRAIARPAMPVPTDLRGAHPLVIATRDASAGQTPSDDGRLRVGPRPGVAHLVLSRSQLRRALLVLQGLLREALRRGWEVLPYPNPCYGRLVGIAIRIDGHDYPIEVHEQTETIPFSQAEIAAWRKESSWPWDLERRANQMPPPQLKRTRLSGRLRLFLPTGYGGGRANWSDGPRGPMERKLPSVLRTLERRAQANDLAAREPAIRIEELRRDAEERETRARRSRIETTRSERLLREVAAWRRSSDLRDYIEALEQRVATLEGDERTRVIGWSSWAREWPTGRTRAATPRSSSASTTKATLDDEPAAAVQWTARNGPPRRLPYCAEVSGGAGANASATSWASPGRDS